MLVRQRLLSWMQNSPDQVLAEMEWSQERGTAEAPDQPASHHLPSVPPTSGAWARAGAPRPRRAILQALPELGLGSPRSARCRPAAAWPAHTEERAQAPHTVPWSLLLSPEPGWQK